MNELNYISGVKKWWYAMLALSLIMIVTGAYYSAISIKQGLGIWNINNPVNWGISITNFVWWIGIGHAGTFISAILLLFRQKWRIPISRTSETMTIIALLCAALFPLIHLGRLPLAFFVFPYPSDRLVWSNFNSPLVWDAFAIGTYFIVSCIYWFIGLMPDLHLYCRNSKSKALILLADTIIPYWSNSQSFYKKLAQLQKIIAGIATALVISVHSIVSFDFATSILPGWHSTIFPPYFVIGAIFSGFAMVVLVLLFTEKITFHNHFLNKNLLDQIGKLIIAMSILLFTGYFHEIITGITSNHEEKSAILLRIQGEFSIIYFFMLGLNIILPQLLWIKKIRVHKLFLFIISIGILTGMWLERYIIVISSLSRDFLSFNWRDYFPSLNEIFIFIGTMGLFLLGILLFIKFIPIKSFTEENIENNAK